MADSHAPLQLLLPDRACARSGSKGNGSPVITVDEVIALEAQIKSFKHPSREHVEISRPDGRWILKGRDWNGWEVTVVDATDDDCRWILVIELFDKDLEQDVDHLLSTVWRSYEEYIEGGS